MIVRTTAARLRGKLGEGSSGSYGSSCGAIRICRKLEGDKISVHRTAYSYQSDRLSSWLVAPFGLGGKMENIKWERFALENKVGW